MNGRESSEWTMVRDVFAGLFGGHRAARSWMGSAVLG